MGGEPSSPRLAKTPAGIISTFKAGIRYRLSKEKNMARIFDDNSLSIGNTPLVKLNRITAGLPGVVAAKIEGRNPSYSVKCRIGASMIWAAERDGILKRGSRDVTIVEPTSGNTGIALAYVAASRGYPLILTMPETMSMERRRLLKAFGADLVLTEGSKGMPGAIAKAEEILACDARKCWMPQQFNNPANPEIHMQTTGPEIWNDTDGNVDILVSGVGTGGTITGVSRYFERVKNKPLWSIAVEPAESPVITAARKGEPLKPGPHKIQGIGAGFIPKVLDLSIVDDVVRVSSDESIEMAHRLHKEEGITAGISSGAAVAAAVKVAAQIENKGKLIVVILPDAGDRYHSSVLFQSIAV
jgi:cysteine synthase A